MRALLLSNQTLSDTLFTERMAAYSSPATDDVVHADRASQPVKLGEGLFKA